MFEDKILMLIDDEIDDVHTLSYYFKRYGVKNILYATNATKGIKEISSLKVKPDLILVDYFLIPAGGLNFIKDAMKASPYKDLRYELMTGRDLDDLEGHIALYKGADDLGLEVRNFIKEFLI